MKKGIILAYLFMVVTTINQPFYSELPSNNNVWATIFVHGIIGIDAKACFANAFQFITDQISHTVYAKSVKYIRSDPFFTKNQAMQGLGLASIDIENYEKGYASGAIARTYNQVLSLCPIKQKTYYYTYGWSGLLSFKARHEDAKRFYYALVDLINQFKKQHNITPKIRLIGYSHGANVCLNLGQVYKEEEQHASSKNLQIDELILLGAPIQRETEKLANSAIFKKIYSFYSRSDNVQKKDLFSSQQIFSKRVFSKHHEHGLPKTLTQVEVKILTEYKPQKKKAFTTSKDKRRKQKATDLTKKSIINGRSWWLQNMSPGHSELWFMAWTPRNYRKNFPLHPVPIVSITPYLIQLIEATSATQKSSSRHLVADIRPDHNYMILRHRYPQKKFTTVSFLTQQTFDKLTSLALVNQPDNYTKQEYNKRRELARTKARSDRKQLLRDRRKNRKNRL